jgi:HSP20 family molecular chaperone IbpA
VHVEPKRLIIYAKVRETSGRERGGALATGKVSDEVFRVLDLPHEIEPDTITATLENEVLEVTLQKVDPHKKNVGNVKAA